MAFPPVYIFAILLHRYKSESERLHFRNCNVPLLLLGISPPKKICSLQHCLKSCIALSSSQVNSQNLAGQQSHFSNPAATCLRKMIGPRDFILISLSSPSGWSSLDSKRVRNWPHPWLQRLLGNSNNNSPEVWINSFRSSQMSTIDFVFS